MSPRRRAKLLARLYLHTPRLCCPVTDAFAATSRAFLAVIPDGKAPHSGGLRLYPPGVCPVSARSARRNCLASP